MLSAADLSMFSMLGRTGAPQKGPPQKEQYFLHAGKMGDPPPNEEESDESKKRSPVFEK